MRRKRFELDGALAEACSANENPINRLRARKPEGMYRRMAAALYDRKRQKREREREGGVSYREGSFLRRREREREEKGEPCEDSGRNDGDGGGGELWVGKRS